MKSTFFLLSILSFSFLCAQEAPEIEWSKNYGGTDNEEIYDIKQTTDGGSIVVGYSISSDIDISENKGLSDYLILKLDGNGSIEWQKTYGGTEIDIAYSVVMADDGGYIIIGESYSTDGDVGEHHGSTQQSDIWLIKLDEDGNIEQNKILGGLSDDIRPSIINTQDGGYAVIAVSSSNEGDILMNHGGTDYWLVKLNSSMEIEWSRTYGGSSNEGSLDVASIAKTNDGGFIVGGNSRSIDGDLSGNFGSSDYWVFKTNQFGDLEWQKSYGGSGEDVGISVIELAGGDYIVTGYTSSADGDVSFNYSDDGNTDIWVVRINQEGNLVWEKSLGNVDSEWGFSVLESNDGNIVLASAIMSSGGDIGNHYGNFDSWITKLNLNGEIIWEKSYGGNELELVNKIKITNNEQLIFAGTSASNDFDLTNNYGFRDAWVVKLAPEQMSTSESNSTEISIFPNPVKNILNFSEKLNDIQIFNLAGQRVLNVSDKNSINVSPLNPGTYLLKAKNQKGENIQLKFIKK